MAIPFNHYFKEKNMTRNDAREKIVRYLEGEELESAFPCWVGHGEDLEPCKRPSVLRVYGINLCPDHGEEAKDGALEEMHQDAYEFFERFLADHVPPLGNPLVLAGVRRWERAVPEGLEYSEGEAERLLLRAFPFRADRVDAETAREIADPNPGNEHPVDLWLDDRHELHAMMRAAFERGMDWLVEKLEVEREHIAAQCAYALALDRGDHPEVLEQARREIVEGERMAAEHFAQKP